MNSKTHTQTKPDKQPSLVGPAGFSQRKEKPGWIEEECRVGRQTLQRDSFSPHWKGMEGEGEVPLIVREVLRSPGQPLHPRTRAFMEQRFGHDFGHVRVHTDTKAAASAHALNAAAFTVGRHITFAEQVYAPETIAGRSLLAHELAHVVQQRDIVIPPRIAMSRPDDEREREANGAVREISVPARFARPIASRIAQRTAAVLQRQVPQTQLATPVSSEPGGRRITLPALRAFSAKERLRFLGLLFKYSGFRPQELVGLAGAYFWARTAKLAIGIGMSASAAALVRLSFGQGIYFGPHGEIGEFRSKGYGWEVGYGVSAGKQWIVMRSLDDFGGRAYAEGLDVTFRAPFAAGIQAIYSDKQPRRFLGIAGSVSLGFGSAVELYEEWSKTSLIPP